MNGYTSTALQTAIKKKKKVVSTQKNLLCMHFKYKYSGSNYLAPNAKQITKNYRNQDAKLHSDANAFQPDN